jgi:hypothetical protein
MMMFTMDDTTYTSVLAILFSQNYKQKITLKYWTPEGKSGVKECRLVNNVDIPSFNSRVVIGVEISRSPVPY